MSKVFLSGIDSPITSYKNVEPAHVTINPGNTGIRVFSNYERIGGLPQSPYSFTCNYSDCNIIRRYTPSSVVTFLEVANINKFNNLAFVQLTVAPPLQIILPVGAYSSISFLKKFVELVNAAAAAVPIDAMLKYTYDANQRQGVVSCFDAATGTTPLPWELHPTVGGIVSTFYSNYWRLMNISSPTVALHTHYFTNMIMMWTKNVNIECRKLTQYARVVSKSDNYQPNEVFVSLPWTRPWERQKTFSTASGMSNAHFGNLDNRTLAGIISFRLIDDDGVYLGDYCPNELQFYVDIHVAMTQ